MAEGFKRCDSSSGVVILNTGVFFTLFWSYFLLHENVGPMMIIGACLGLAGAIAVIRTDRNAIDQRPNATDRPAYEVKTT
jgi:drug/metabolite transporter (DMT)-like permease